MRILFVCTGNTCRSPMAAALMNKIAKDNDLDIGADSAGIFAEEGVGASDEAVEAVKKYDIDLSAHKAKTVSDALIRANDVILTMTEAHKMVLKNLACEKVFTIAEYAGSFGDIPDPFGGDLFDYEETLEEIYDLLTDIAERVADEV